MTTSIVPETFVKSITYSRADRDYTATLDGQYIGSFRSYHDAEVALDQVAYDIARATATRIALAERAAESSTEAPLLDTNDLRELPPNTTWQVAPCSRCKQLLIPRIVCGNVLQGWCPTCLRAYPCFLRPSNLINGWQEAYFTHDESLPDAPPTDHTCDAPGCAHPATHTIDTIPPTQSCCFHYSEEFTGRVCGRRPVVAPELLAEADQVLETPESYFADPTPLDIARTAATQIALAERARLLRRWAQDVGRPMHAFFILPGGEAAEQACLVVNGEPVHVSAALVAAALGAGR